MGALSGLSGLSAVSGVLPITGEQPIAVWDNTITIDWTAAGTPINRKNYVINAYRAFDPSVTDTVEYLNLLSDVAPEFIRIHSMDMMKDSSDFDLGWVQNASTTDYAWDAVKIQAALNPLAGRNVSLTICRFPAALCGESETLLPSNTDEFAGFCVQLIGIVQQTGVNLQSVGLLNELDLLYGSETSWHSIWTTARNAIKAAYPNLAIGGACFGNPWAQGLLDGYLQACGSQMDYFCANSYATDWVASEDNQLLWHRAADGIKGLLMYLRWRLDEAGLWGKPIQLSEAGLSYATGDPGNASEIRGVWEALRLVHTSTEPGAGILAWNEADDTHGIVSSPSSGFMRRMAFHVYRAFNAWMDGTAYPLMIAGETLTIPNNDESVVPSISALAVVNGDFGHAIAIVNRSGATRTVKVNHTGWAAEDWYEHQKWVISPDATTQKTTITQSAFMTGEFTIAPNSIHLLQSIDLGS